MNAERFDALVESVAGGSRRGALRLLAGLAFGGAVGMRGPLGADAAKCKTKCKNRRWSERRIKRIITKAAKRYNQPRKDLLRVARCESVLDPCAENPAGPWYGLFQFLCSTWQSTPYADENMFDPKANANAAAWMWKQGRRDEWVCQ